jgi:hypothetical protein
LYEKIEHLTAISVARGVGFGALTIICFMVGFASSPVNVLRAGGFGSLLICMVLYIKGLNCSPQDYRRTEVWIMLDKHEREPADVAAVMISNARRTALLRWAQGAAWAAASMLSVAVLLMFAS